MQVDHNHPNGNLMLGFFPQSWQMLWLEFDPTAYGRKSCKGPLQKPLAQCQS